MINQGRIASLLGMKGKFKVLMRCRQDCLESQCLPSYYFDYILKFAACEVDKHFPEGWGIQFEKYFINREL